MQWEISPIQQNDRYSLPTAFIRKTNSKYYVNVILLKVVFCLMAST